MRAEDRSRPRCRHFLRSRHPSFQRLLMGTSIIVETLPILAATPAHAFKPKGHISIVNQSRASVKNASGDYKRAAVTVSGIGDRDLDNPEVAKAVQLCPDHSTQGRYRHCCSYPGATLSWPRLIELNSQFIERK